MCSSGQINILMDLITVAPSELIPQCSIALVVIGGHWWSFVVTGGHWWSLVVMLTFCYDSKESGPSTILKTVLSNCRHFIETLITFGQNHSHPTVVKRPHVRHPSELT